MNSHGRRGFNLLPFYSWEEEAWRGSSWTADRSRFNPNLFLMRGITINYQLLTVLVLLEVLWAEDLGSVRPEEAASTWQSQREGCNVCTPGTQGVFVCVHLQISCPRARREGWDSRFWLAGLCFLNEVLHLSSLKTADLSLESLVKRSAECEEAEKSILYFCLLLKQKDGRISESITALCCLRDGSFGVETDAGANLVGWKLFL